MGGKIFDKIMINNNLRTINPKVLLQFTHYFTVKRFKKHVLMGNMSNCPEDGSFFYVFSDMPVLNLRFTVIYVSYLLEHATFSHSFLKQTNYKLL